MSSYTIFKPYTQYRSMTNKSLWFISHDYSLNKIKSQITGCVSNKKKVQAVITCTRYMHALKIGDYVFEEYIKLFCYLFQNQQPFYFKSKKTNICTDPNQSIKPPKTPESSKLTNKSKEEGCDYFIKYRNMKQVIFSFVYLDNFRVKCTFVKQK